MNTTLHTPLLNQAPLQYIEQQNLPLYDYFDRAHQRDHVQMVIKQSMKLAKQLDVDAEMVYFTTLTIRIKHADHSPSSPLV